MAAGTFTLFRANMDNMALTDLAGATIKLALVTSSATIDASNTGNTLWATHSANEIAAGAGYTAGGQALANDAVSTTTNGWKYDSDDVVWNASGGNIPAWRYGIMYVSGTLWGMTDPLIGYFLGDSTPADVPATVDGNPLTVAPAAGGWFTKTQA